MPAIESRTEAFWLSKQTAKGTPASTAVKRLRKVGGTAGINRDDASQPWSDGNRFQTAEDYVNTILGNGAPVTQGQAGVLAYLLYLSMGQETVTAVPGPTGLYDHVATPSNAGGFWFTSWSKVGESVGPHRVRYTDCRLSSLRIEASSAQKVVNATPTFLSLLQDVFITDPVAVEDTDRALLYYEGEGRFTINSAIFRGHSATAFTLDEAATPWYGDSVYPFDVVFGASAINIEGVTLLVDQQGKDYYDETIFGTTSPPAGTRPRVDLPLIGSYSIDLRKGTVIDLTPTGVPTGGSFTLTVDGVVTAAIPFNATATQIQTAIEALANVAVGDVSVSGGPLPGTPARVIFTRAARVVTATDTLTGGTSPTSGLVDRGHEKGLKVEFPGVKWTSDLSIEGNPDGGPVELALGAQTRKVAGQPMIRTTVRCADAAFV